MEIVSLEFSQTAKLILGLLSVVNPLGAIPIFLSLTAEEQPASRSKIGSVAAFSVGIILLVAMFVGAPLLKGLGISLSSFRIAGGILILLMALKIMLNEGTGSQNIKTAEPIPQENHSAAVVPISMPLLAGPGAISAVILFAQQNKTLWEEVALVLSIIVTALVVWLCLSAAPQLARILGVTGMRIMSRIMGLLLAALGVEFISKGLMASFHVLAK